MKALILCIAIVFLCFGKVTSSYAQLSQTGPTDTLLFNEFYNLPGNPTILTYGYSNGNGYFFGTNFLDLDQDPNTPYEYGTQSCAQGFPLDTSESYYILDILVRVGIKIKGPNSSGTPLILSINYLDDSTTYNINTSSGTQSYTIKSPGTARGSASIAWNDMITGAGYNYSVAHFNTPVFVDQSFAVVMDFVDFYLNGDRIGLWASAPNGGSNIYGLENTLWLYPNPMLWLQVNHLYANVNRAIAVFPVVDDGTFGIEHDAFLHGMKLGQCAPNPAQDFTQIEYEIAQSKSLVLEIFDGQGKLIQHHDLGKKAAGKYKFRLPTNSLKSGMYYYSLQAEGKNLTKKLVVKK